MYTSFVVILAGSINNYLASIFISESHSHPLVGCIYLGSMIGSSKSKHHITSLTLC